MSIVLEAVLAAEDVARVQAGLAAAPWKDGRKTAGAAAKQVKSNEQADAEDAGVAALARFVLEALRRHPLFEIAARPAAVSRVMFSRYAPGMEYGAHTDDALMGPPEARLRTDLAFTIFLAARDSYEGGALVIESALGEQAVKLEAGDAILYPAGSIHRVAPVQSGARIAAVGWVQSLIADAAQREILFDLSVARTRLAGAGVAREELLKLDKAVSNLLRVWARP
jgi:PKHD-type hydroxylase